VKVVKHFKINKIIMTAVFFFRRDTVTNTLEGEVYYADKKGILTPNIWSSLKLAEHGAVIATGVKAIQNVFKQYSEVNIIDATPQLSK
jgi:hypothetical protein